MKKKAWAVLLTTAMLVNTFTLPAFADAEDTYVDGTYTGSATVTPIEYDGETDFDPYDISVDITVSDGRISNVSLNSAATIARTNKPYFDSALRGIRASVIANNGTTGVDAVSEATCSSKTILTAVNSALEGHKAAEEKTTDKTALQSAIHVANGLTETDYTEESWSALTEALSSANNVNGKEDVTQDEIDQAAKNLNNAIGLLEKNESCVYVKMNIPFERFYQGMVSDDVDSAIDAVTTATTKGKAQLYIDSGNFYGKSANEIDGVTIPVRISEETYEELKDKVSDATEDYYLGSAVEDPDVYLEVSWTEDGGYKFSDLKGSTVDGGTVPISEEWQTKRRDIEILLDTSVVSTPASELYGGYVTTTNGTKYPLLPMESMYSASGIKEIGWSLGDKTEQRNSAGDLVMTLQPEIYESMKGKTLDSMTLFTTSGITSYSLRDETSGAAVKMSYPVDPFYVLMNIPYSEFYAAEGTSDVDAVTSATLNKTRTSSLAGGSYHVNSDGSDITGIIYPVKVSDPTVLENLKQVTDTDSVDITVTNRGTTTTTTYAGKDALFENDTYAYYELAADEIPAYYKELTVNADGSFSFSEVKGVSDEKQVTAELLTGEETSYGDYQIDLLDGYEAPETIYGAVIHTKEGGSYGLKHVENIWINGEFAISTGHTTSVHGNPLQVYSEAEGQTVTGMTLYTENGEETLTFTNELYLAPFYEMTAAADNEQTVSLSGLPADIQNAKATVSYKEGSGRTAVTHTLAEDADIVNGKVALTEGTLAEGIDYTVTVTGDNYAAQAASFTYQAAEPTSAPDPGKDKTSDNNTTQNNDTKNNSNQNSSSTQNNSSTQKNSSTNTSGTDNSGTSSGAVSVTKTSDGGSTGSTGSTGTTTSTGTNSSGSLSAVKTADSVQTGDIHSVLLAVYAVVFALCAAMLTVLIYRRKKNR